MALNNPDVQKQIEHMMKFIEQEAKEKVEEIDCKAEEEFNIEKGRLVQQERLKIINHYERKEKQVELQKKIQRSSQMNQSRLKILKAQDDHVKAILDESAQRLGSVTKDEAKYKQILQGLVTQGLFQLLEPTVLVRCRQQDLNLVKGVLKEAVDEYKKVVKKECALSVDEQNFLGPECSGGIDLLAKEGKIKVQNTLESRLELISRQMLPEIRETLFGRNKTRKFLD